MSSVKSSDSGRSIWRGVASAVGVVDVVRQLCDQRIDPVELALAAQEVREANLGDLAVHHRSTEFLCAGCYFGGD